MMSLLFWNLLPNKQGKMRVFFMPVSLHLIFWIRLWHCKWWKRPVCSWTISRPYYISLRDLAFAHQETMTVGRSHGIHGEPITFGWKVAIWYQEFERQQHRLKSRDCGYCGRKIIGCHGDICPSVSIRGKNGLSAIGVESQHLFPIRSSSETGMQPSSRY